MTITIVNAETGEVIVRDLTTAEAKQKASDDAKAIAKRAKLEAEAEAKETAKQAILDRIGLTADELQTILG
jgi:hypothetical protein